MPNSINNSKQLDLKNGDSLWCGVTAKEKYNILVALKILKDNEYPPPGWTKSSRHWMFDVKMYSTSKSIWVKDRHQTPDPETSSCAGVVSCKIIRILITYVKLM